MKQCGQYQAADHFTQTLSPEAAEPRHFTMSLHWTASHNAVLRTRLEVRREHERLRARRSLLLKTMLPSVLFTLAGLLIALHPEFEACPVYKLGVLYCWGLAVVVPLLVVRKEKRAGVPSSHELP
jgi:hypothetical protein